MSVTGCASSMPADAIAPTRLRPALRMTAPASEIANGITYNKGGGYRLWRDDALVAMVCNAAGHALIGGRHGFGLCPCEIGSHARQANRTCSCGLLVRPACSNLLFCGYALWLSPLQPEDRLRGF